MTLARKVSAGSPPVPMICFEESIANSTKVLSPHQDMKVRHFSHRDCKKPPASHWVPFCIKLKPESGAKDREVFWVGREGCALGGEVWCLSGKGFAIASAPQGPHKLTLWHKIVTTIIPPELFSYDLGGICTLKISGKEELSMNYAWHSQRLRKSGFQIKTLS